MAKAIWDEAPTGGEAAGGETAGGETAGGDNREDASDRDSESGAAPVVPNESSRI